MGDRSLLTRLRARIGWTTRDQKLDRLAQLVESIAARQKQEEKWRRVIRLQLNALIRHAAFAGSDLPAPFDLGSRRFQLRSQNEEDGITLALLAAGGCATRRFVEIGCGRKGGNSAVLAFDMGWAGLMVDGNKRHIAHLKNLMNGNPRVTFARTMVTSANINDLLDSHHMRGEIDLMSIDVDSTDYWLLEAMSACSPRVLIMEYNALFGPERAVTLPNQEPPPKRPKGYFGASLAALEKLARRKGYRLVLCEETGINAFFLRDDVAPHMEGLTSRQAYRCWLDRRQLLDPQPHEIDIYELIERHHLPLVSV
jgi:hypothetical protein